MRDVVRIFGFLTAGIVILTILAAPAVARQGPVDPPTNLDVLDSLATDCLGILEPLPSRLLLQTDDRSAFLRPAVLDRLVSGDRDVFVEDPPLAGIHTLSLALDGARIVYRREGRGLVRRRIDIDLRALLRDSDARVVREESCHRTFSDVVSEPGLDRLESATNPMGRGERPPAGLRRRWLEPALLTTALGAVVYLFFTIRSQSDG